MAMQKTYMAKKTDVTPNWYIVDANAEIVGRLAARIANVLMGKHKPSYTPHVDCGDYVIVLNADRVRFSGGKMQHPRHPYFSTKMEKKTYQHYTGYPSGRRVEAAIDIWERKPEMILHEAVRRMLPKNKLARQMLKKLKLQTGTKHEHQAQQPVDLPDYL